MILNQKLKDSENLAVKKTNEHITELDQLRKECEQIQEELQIQESAVINHDLEMKQKEEQIDKQKTDIKILNEHLKKVLEMQDGVKFRKQTLEFQKELLQSKDMLIQLAQQLEVSKNQNWKLQDKVDGMNLLQQSETMSGYVGMELGSSYIRMERGAHRGQMAGFVDVGDPIEHGLTLWINQHPEKEKLKVLFIKESDDGVYQFGSRCIKLKIGLNKQVQVHIGDRYMSLQTFVDKFLPSEQQYEQIRPKNQPQQISVSKPNNFTTFNEVKENLEKRNGPFLGEQDELEKSLSNCQQSSEQTDIANKDSTSLEQFP